MKINKRVIILSILLLTFAAKLSLFASNDAGFKIQKGSSSFELRFTLTESFEHRESQFLSIPNSIFLKALNWFYFNHEIIDQKELNLVVYVTPQDHSFIFWDYGNEHAFYTDEEDFFIVMINKINKELGINTIIPESNLDIPAYRLSSKEYISDISDISELYMGSFPSYMYDFDKKEYFLVFWNLNSLEDFLKKNPQKEFSIIFTLINSENINKIFNRIG